MRQLMAGEQINISEMRERVLECARLGVRIDGRPTGALETNCSYLPRAVLHACQYSGMPESDFWIALSYELLKAMQSDMDRQLQMLATSPITIIKKTLDSGPDGQ